MAWSPPRSAAPRHGYLLVTPVHDERDLLDDLAATIRGQELRPIHWVIVDDGSTDGSAEVLARLAAREPWIHVVTATRRGPEASSPRRYAEVLAIGFAAAGELAQAEGLEVPYVANIDADVRPPPWLMAELVARSERDRMVGIASCPLVEVGDDGHGLARLEHPCGAPRAGLRLWRRGCLDEIAYYATPHWGSVTGLRARNRGWKTVVHRDLTAELVRGDGSRGGWWQGYQRRGEAVWYLGAHPLLVAVEAAAVCAAGRDLRGVALMAGYLTSALRGRSRSSDAELLEFYGSELPRRRWQRVLGRLARRGHADEEA